MFSIAGNARPRRPVPRWYKVFRAMLPKIVGHARISFRYLNSEARAEAVQEVVCNALKAFVRLVQLKKTDLAYPTVLARYGVAQTRDHRKVGGHLNVCDVLSPYCQRLKSVVVERLDHYDDKEDAWQEAVVVDTRSAPVPDIVAFRCDFADWLRSLKRRGRRIAESLALGNRTTGVAKRFKVCSGRISRIRRELAANWHRFVGDEPEAAAAWLTIESDVPIPGRHFRRPPHRPAPAAVPLGCQGLGLFDLQPRNAGGRGEPRGLSRPPGCPRKSGGRQLHFPARRFVRIVGSGPVVSACSISSGSCNACIQPILESRERGISLHATHCSRPRDGPGGIVRAAARKSGCRGRTKLGKAQVPVCRRVGLARREPPQRPSQYICLPRQHVSKDEAEPRRRPGTHSPIPNL
jgi:hypothetical protein